MYLFFLLKVLIFSLLLMINISVNAQEGICFNHNGSDDGKTCYGQKESCFNDKRIDFLDVGCQAEHLIEKVCIGQIKKAGPSGVARNPPKKLQCQGNLISLEVATTKEMFLYHQKLAQANQLLSSIANNLSSMPNLASDSLETKNFLNNALTSHYELRSTINARFDQLPPELITLSLIKKLREEILFEVDRRISDNK